MFFDCRKPCQPIVGLGDDEQILALIECGSQPCASECMVLDEYDRALFVHAFELSTAGRISENTLPRSAPGR